MLPPLHSGPGAQAAEVVLPTPLVSFVPESYKLIRCFYISQSQLDYIILILHIIALLGAVVVVFHFQPGWQQLLSPLFLFCSSRVHAIMYHEP